MSVGQQHSTRGEFYRVLLLCSMDSDLDFVRFEL